MKSLIVRLFAILFTMSCFYGAGHEITERHAFNSRGKSALVEPIAGYEEVTTTKTKLGMKTSESKEHFADISFTTADGQRVTVKKKLPDEILEKFKTGQPVNIVYLPESPSHSRLPGEGINPYFAALLGLLGAGGTWLFWKRM